VAFALLFPAAVRVIKEQTMKLARVNAITLAILTVATVAQAQRPDFSGTWTMDSTSGSSARDGGSALGNGPAKVTQTADALTIQRRMGDADVTLIYKLDGSESRNVMTVTGGQAVDSMSIAKWEGSRLSIVSKREMGGQVTESSELWSLEGGTLTLETTSAHGTQRRIYKK
jgi:hypothetical protein